MRCSVYMAMSVDGFVARPDDRLDWLESVQVAGEDYGYKSFIDTVDVLVMGRRTYEVALGFPQWPYAGRRVIVLSRSRCAARHGAEVTAETPSALVERLASNGATHVYVDGGALIRSFLRAGLIDDLTLSVVPIILGQGIRLFGDDLPTIPLVVDESRAFPTGLVQTRYRIER